MFLMGFLLVRPVSNCGRSDLPDLDLDANVDSRKYLMSRHNIVKAEQSIDNGNISLHSCYSTILSNIITAYDFPSMVSSPTFK